MDEKSLEVHAHQIDADQLIEKQLARGYVLLERTPPTIVAQAGFERFVFVPAEEAERLKTLENQPTVGPVENVRMRIRAFLRPVVD